MEKDKKKVKFIHQPEYPGGPKELTKFIYAQLRYPKEAFEAGVEGVVFLEYDIDYRGEVVGTRILKGLGHGCDEEAARVVRLLKFSVARNRGIQVLFHQKVRVKFALPKVKTPPAPTMQVTYTVTSSTTTEPQETVYSYTIVPGDKG